MKYFKYSILLLPLVFILVGCPKDDEFEQIPIRPFGEVYNEDIEEIEKFMKEHTMTVDDDYNVTFTKITDMNANAPKIFDRADKLFKTVEKDGVSYKLYYFKLAQGTEASPTKLDSVFTSYKGYKTNLTIFDQNQNPVWFNLDDFIQNGINIKVINGWTEILPEFKSGTAKLNSDGTVDFANFGAGVVFVPSGLAYFNRGASVIGPYEPIIFSFKLNGVRFRDHDGDKIYSKDEYGLITGDPKNNDVDNQPDYLDIDDDNDGIFTKKELDNLYNPTLNPNYKKDERGYYIYETIPTCLSGNIKVHLDKNCK